MIKKQAKIKVNTTHSLTDLINLKNYFDKLIEVNQNDNDIMKIKRSRIISLIDNITNSLIDS